MLSKRIIKVLFPVLCVAVQVRVSAVDMDSKAISVAVAKFSAKFCKELEKNKNMVSSPISAEFVLALLTLGSTDEVHSELLESLGIANDDSILSHFTSVSAKLKSIKGVTLNMANKVYINDGPYELNKQLKEDAMKVFDADFEKVNFDDRAAAADLINKWVESKTNDRIKDLLDEKSVSSDTRVVLVNALYFKGTWKSPFDTRRTMNMDFHIDSSNSVQVPMMHQKNSFYYGESKELDAKLLRMSYEGDEASMLIILPNKVNGLDNVLQKLASGHELITELEKMFQTKVKVALPKFKIETEIDLTTILQKLGIESIFNPVNRGLRKLIEPEEPLYVSTAVQKASIEVNEDGAEAASATAIGVQRLRGTVDNDPVQTFVANHPYLVAILVDNIPYFYAINRNGS